MITDTAVTHISKSEAAHILGISTASIYNWVKHGYLSPVNKNMYLYAQVMDLKQKIAAGTVARLNKRANKSQSVKTFLPAELLIHKRDAEKLSAIISFILSRKIHTEAALFTLAIKLLQKRQLLPHSLTLHQFCTGALMPLPGRMHLAKELLAWHKSIPGNLFTSDTHALLDFEPVEQQDFLGIIYQSITREGSKARHGSYYTPGSLVTQIADDYGDDEPLFLDPCCGTGQFLLAFGKQLRNPEKLYGIDIDLTAVRIARINLHLLFPDLDFKPHLYHGNALTDKWDFPQFDVIATNPPWGFHFSGELLTTLEHNYPELCSRESAAYFLKKGIDWLSAKGKLIFLLPEALLNVKTHEDIRGYILEHTRVKSIKYLKQVFKNVFTPVIILALHKQKKREKTIVFKDRSTFKIDNHRFALNPGKIFDIHMETRDAAIIGAVYNKAHTTLKDKADWALGIVTGNNARYILTAKQGVDFEPVYKGKDINPFVFAPPGNYILFQPAKFQQVAPLEKYRATEKLVYKFISHRLVFAYDTEKRLTLNSANILIPRVPAYPAKVILALFNSTLYQFIFQKKFSTIKVLRSHLEQLPLPLPDQESITRIVNLVDGILKGEDKFRALDDVIFRFFGCGEEDQAYIREHVK